MVAFSQLVVFVAAGLSAVSAIPFSVKRDLAADAANIGPIVDTFVQDVANIDPTNPNATTTAITNDMNNLVTVLQLAIIREQGEPQLTSLPPTSFNLVLGNLTTLLTEIDNEAATIASIPNLGPLMADGMGTVEDVTVSYMETVIPILPDADQGAAIGVLYNLLTAFLRVEASLTSPPVSN